MLLRIFTPGKQLMTNDVAHTLINSSAKLRLYAGALEHPHDGWTAVLANLPERLRKLADDIDQAAEGLTAAEPIADAMPNVPKDLGTGTSDTPHAESPKVLLVEDDPDSRELTRMLLENDGWTVLEAADGPPALDLLARVPVGLVLMDTRLVTQTGHAVVATLRRSQGPNQHTPVVGLSASPLPQERQAAFAAGMDDWVVKPLLRHHVTALRQRFV